jgi:hypothetical protein
MATLKAVQWSWIFGFGLILGCVLWMRAQAIHRTLPLRTDILISMGVGVLTTLLLLAVHASADYFDVAGALLVGWIVEPMLLLLWPPRADRRPRPQP